MKAFLSLRALIILFFVSVVLSSTVVAQSDKYTVRYRCIVSTKQPLKGDDSIAIIQNGRESVAPLGLPDSITVDQEFLTCLVDGNKDSALLKHKTQRTVLTMFYRNGIWSFDNRGVNTELPLQTATYEKTAGKKVILGYDCAKVFIITPQDKLVAWIAKDLPNTLMPVAGYAPLEGAVLELYSPTVRFVAEEVFAKD